MKRRIFVLLLVLTLCLVGCEKAPGEETLPSETETVPTTAVPTTMPPTMVLPETTEPPRVYVPQDPDPLTYPEGHYQGTLALFARMLYVHDNRSDTVLPELPEGFVYVGVSGDFSDSETAKYALSTWHIPVYTEFFASPDETDYIYYKTENGYRLMIRAALVENYWGGAELDPAIPEAYTFLFFESLLTSCTRSRSVYNLSTGMTEYTSPKDVDLSLLFYNGFPEEKEIPLSGEEERFLGNLNYELSNSKRLPVEKMDAVLKRFFGLSYTDTNRIGKENMAYRKENDCFYLWASSSRSEDLEVLSAEFDPETDTYAVKYRLTIYNSEKIITFRRVGDVLQILSNVGAEANKTG